MKQAYCTMCVLSNRTRTFCMKLWEQWTFPLESARLFVVETVFKNMAGDYPVET